MIKLSSLTILVACLTLATLQGCAPASSPPPRAVVVPAPYYYGPSPYYYDGHLVYYDVTGRPIYFVAGVRYRVPGQYRRYGLFVRDYEYHREEYRRRPHEQRRHPHRPPRAPRERRSRRDR